jgi:sporulation protein YlmC with PRC-barrel domain
MTHILPRTALHLFCLALPMALSIPGFCAQPDAASASDAGGLERASRLVGAKLEDSNGWEVGRVEDLLVDPQAKRVVLAVLTVGGRFQANSAPVGLKLPSDDLAFVKGAVRSRTTMADLDHLPALASAIEDLEPGVRARAVSAKALLDADLRDGGGRDIGGMEDFVVNLSDGTLRFLVADYDPSWRASGKFVQVHDLSLRKDGDEVSVVVDDAAMRSAPAYRDARWPGLSDDTFSGRFARWTNFN